MKYWNVDDHYHIFRQIIQNVLIIDNINNRLQEGLHISAWDSHICLSFRASTCVNTGLVMNPK